VYYCSSYAGTNTVLF
nr:immunoglobulin light chain junction region [Macaca mulatta]MOW66161.1 immunoglobulin light chain junction region [Macaca mulatta]MOW66182.1 immunoglobulin light chain junction region [Macaca mulatta]MOW66223.1 immunoglobulin light chain junction region [Macaca mulatta]MOW66260.1 immunoglobulin light chain junction region [Macaca mulatta]